MPVLIHTSSHSGRGASSIKPLDALRMSLFLPPSPRASSPHRRCVLVYTSSHSGHGASSLKPLSPHHALASPFFSSTFWCRRFHLARKFQESRASTSSAPRSPSRQSSPLKMQRAVVYSSSWSLVVHALRPLKSYVNPLCPWLLPQVCRVANNYSMTFRICGVGYMDPGVVLWLLGRRRLSLPGYVDPFIWCANPLSSSSSPPACSPPPPSVNAVIRDVLPTDRATHGVVDHLQHELPPTRQPSPPLRPRRKPEV
ncbi:hypothetical protein B0H13DRAFT_2678762 [Mycena leptocephala]|nr:hypothetical protein B0H13DRAFT_2678762 [Mycena leptocephala]